MGYALNPKPSPCGNAFPSTLIISRNQRIAGRIIGNASASNLSNLIQKAQKQP